MDSTKKYDRIRASGICIHNNKILLIHRINLELEKEKQEYYVIPGGGVEDGETIEDAVIREMKEETSLDVRLGGLFHELEDYDGQGKFLKYYAYICEYIGGTISLEENSVEAVEMKDGSQFFNPVWFPLSEIQDIVLYPAPLKKEILTRCIN